MRTLVILSLASLVFINPSIASDDPPIDYAKTIKPLLRARCYTCHGPLKQKNDLRLDTVDLMTQGGLSGPAIVPGSPEDSPLINHITAANGAARMPPQSEGSAFDEAEVAALTAWVEQGAIGTENERPEADPKDHWAFQVPKRPPVPGPGHPIDAFLQAERAKHSLVPQAPADKRTLLRRVSIDLIGLPPSKSEIQAFLDDTTPDAYEKVVDRLLASAQYGERWGRHWMDVWRYSEWWGLGDDVRNGMRHVWRWRDWIIESTNANKGYDQMIREMLAADEFYPTDTDRLRATGYLVRPYFRFSRNTWLEEVVEHSSKAFLGLTLNCVKCHDHKYDPLTQEDFYKFRAFFEPYQVRMDLVGGELNFDRNGLPRAFDCNPDAPTYMFERGDENRPLKDRTIAPGLPELLTFQELKITPVELPLEAHAPGRTQEVIARYMDDAQSRLAEARGVLDDVRRQFEQAGKDDEDRLGRAKLALTHGEKSVTTAELMGSVVQARAAADEARFSRPPAENAKDLARAASKTDRQHALARAEETLAKAEWLAAFADEPGASREEVDDAKQAVDKARSALDSESEEYTSIRGALKARESPIETPKERVRPYPSTSTGRRSALAQWLTDRRNPLPARVAVNHIWMRHYGRPLVPNVFDFGRKAPGPTHPELLDWLAVEFIDHGWDMKSMHRLMVTSDAYRMSSSSAGADVHTRELDPENAWYWRMNSTRMEAQAIRDSMLAHSGELDLTMGGESIPVSEEAAVRRSVYFVHSHNDHERFLSNFDDASVLECYRRTESILPQQALSLENSRLAMRAAERIARSIDASDNAAFIREGFQLILGCSPTIEELAVAERGF